MNLVVHCECFSLASVMLLLDLPWMQQEKAQGLFTNRFIFFPQGSNHPSALIRDIHLSAGGEFFSIFNLIVLSAYMTSILEF